MRSSSLALAVMGMVLGAGLPRAIANDTAADERAIRAIEERHRLGIEQHNLAELMLPYGENTTVMPAGHAALQGREAIRAFFSAMIEGRKIAMTFAPEKLEFSDAGDLAIEVGRTDLRTEDPASGKTARYLSKYIVIWRRAGATWYAAYDMWNSDSA